MFFRAGTVSLCVFAQCPAHGGSDPGSCSWALMSEQYSIQHSAFLCLLDTEHYVNTIVFIGLGALLLGCVAQSMCTDTSFKVVYTSLAGAWIPGIKSSLPREAVGTRSYCMDHVPAQPSEQREVRPELNLARGCDGLTLLSLTCGIMKSMLEHRLWLS